MTSAHVERRRTLEALADDARHCGYCNSGRRRGCKQSVLLTYLQDGVRHRR